MRGAPWTLIGASLLLPAALLAGDADAEKEVQDLLAGYRSAVDAWIAPFKNAGSDEERTKLPPLRSEDDPALAYLPKLQALAERAKGTEPALTALLWIVERGANVQRGGPEAAEKAIAEIAARHAASPRLERICERLQHLRYRVPRVAVLRALRTVLEKTPDKAVKGAAILSVAAIESGEWPPEDESEDGDAEAKEWDEAGALLAQAVKECAGTRWADLAAGLIRERERLQIGMTAPDFEAVDVDGKKFRLSDYRGRVVVLDFWGFG
jgi:hypothetical protein